MRGQFKFYFMKSYRNMIHYCIFFNWLSLEKVKFMFSKKVTKIDEIFTVNLTVTTYCQIDGDDFVNFCGLLRKCELKRKQFCLIEK